MSALDCQRAVQYGCPICMVVWRHATADGTVDVAALKLEAAFSTWSVSTNGERDEHQRHRHWSEDTVTLTISTGSVSYARGLGPMHVIANDHLDFALVHVSRRSGTLRATGCVDGHVQNARMTSLQDVLLGTQARTLRGSRSTAG